MTKLSITVCCPRCAITIAGVTPETMVYCIACRKWCREVGEIRKEMPVAVMPAPRPPRRRFRCH